VLGGLLALLSAVTFAGNVAGTRRGVLVGSALQAMAITVPIGVPLFFVATFAAGELGALSRFSPQAAAALAAAGILHFVWGRYCNYRSLAAIGANLAAPVQQVNLIISLILAIAVLGEKLTALRLVGIALVLLGPSFTLREARKAAQPPASALSADVVAPAAFKPRRAEGYMWALLCATGYGLSPVLIRIGVENGGLRASLAGGLISSMAAAAVLAVMLLWPGQLRHALAVKPEAAKWFTLSGVLVCISQMFYFMAMAVAPVTVVAPINRLTIVFRLYFSRLLNPQHEVFGGRIVVGTLISLLGAVALSLSTETVSSMLPLPDAVAAVLLWHWP